jgi:hypothetical protein
MNRVGRTFALALSASLLAGCAHLNTQVDRKAGIRGMKHLFVEHNLSDGRNLDQLIARELRKLGYDASAGPMTMMPDGTEAIIAYRDTWNFDFTNYLLELDIAVRTPGTGREIAVGGYRHPSLLGTDPVAIVDKVLDPIFKQK